MANIIRGGEGNLQLPGRRSAWGDFNTPDPTGDLIKNINQRKQDFKDFYNTQKDEIEELNKALTGMQGADFAHMQNKIIETRNEIAKLYSTANQKNYNSPDFQAKLYKIKDDFVKLKSVIDNSTGQLAQAKQWADQAKYTVRDDVTGYLKQQAQLPPDKRDPNPLNTIQNDPRFFNPYSALEGAVKEYGQTAEHSYVVPDKMGERIVNQKYNSALYKLNPKTNEIEFNPADDMLDALLQDQRMVNQAMNWIPANKGAILTGQGHDDMTPETLRNGLKEYIKQNELLKNRYPVSTDGTTVVKASQPSAAGMRKEEEEQANLALWNNAQRNPQEAISGYLVDKNGEGPIAAEPIREGDQIVGYNVTFRKKNPDPVKSKLPGDQNRWVDEVKQISIRNFGDRENFFNQVVNPFADRRNTKKQTGEVTESKAIKSDGKDVKSWKPENQYQVGNSIYYYDQADKKWKKK